MKTINPKSWEDVPENYTGIIGFPDGTKRWFLNGKPHRTDGPAVEYTNGVKHWCLNGKRHRIDGPAYEDSKGTKYWFLNDKGYTREEHFQYAAKNHPESIRKLIWNL